MRGAACVQAPPAGSSPRAAPARRWLPPSLRRLLAARALRALSHLTQKAPPAGFPPPHAPPPTPPPLHAGSFAPPTGGGGAREEGEEEE